MLVRVEGTPLADEASIEPLELVRTIATARILMPASMVRLSAGRLALSEEAQALCFLAGANSIFMGEKLLTTPNPEADADRSLLDKLGMRLMPQVPRRRRPGSLTCRARLQFEERVRRRIRELEKAGLRRILQPPSGIDLSSNDYLGLANHPRIKQRMAEAVLEEGCGSTASRLLRGERASLSGGGAAVRRVQEAMKQRSTSAADTRQISAC